MPPASLPTGHKPGTIIVYGLFESTLSNGPWSMPMVKLQAKAKHTTTFPYWDRTWLIHKGTRHSIDLNNAGNADAEEKALFYSP
eukprot:1421568-Amphidinium_carterae.1